jgi:tRNA 2-thiouridine synthesizing protein A
MSSSRDDDQPPGRSEALIEQLARMSSARCIGCGGAVSSHHMLMSIVLGFKETPRCLPCLAKGLNEDPEKLSESLVKHISQRRCFARAWNWANWQAGLPLIEIPTEEDRESVSHSELEEYTAKDFWDAGEQGCGELALELRLRVEGLRPGEILHLVARDPGVPEDLPAWCRLTGHKLLKAAAPNYWIRRKD